MERDNFLTVDIGSGSIRVSVFNSVGDNLVTVRQSMPMSRTLNAEDVFQQVVRLIQSIVQGDINPRTISGIAVSSQIAIVSVDREGSSTYPVLTWADRKDQEAKRWQQKITDREFFLTTGRKVSGEAAGVKMSWLKRCEADVYKQTAHFISLKDYIILQLTGNTVTDVVHAAFSGLYSIVEQQWSDDLLTLFGLDRHKLPSVYDGSAVAGKVTKRAASLTGLMEGTPVVTAGPDGTVAAVGAGVYQTGDAIDVSGTTDVYYQVVDQPVFDKEMRVITNPHLVPDVWLVGGPTTTTGGTVTWFLENWNLIESSKEETLKKLEAEAEKISPGARGLLFYPCFVGHRVPHWEPEARGVMIGLTPHHRSNEMYRSIIEGGAFLLREVTETVGQLLGTAKEFRMIGGGSASRLVKQIRADITGKTLIEMKEKEATSLGSAILAAVGAGVYQDVSAAVQQMTEVRSQTEPDRSNQEKYERLFQTYQTVYRHIRPAFKEINQYVE